MREAGYKVSEDKVFHGNYWITQGPEMADFFIREDGSLPEAIICSNDYEAIAICNELIKRGYVSPYKLYAPNLNIDFSDLKKSMGDYNNEQLGEKMSSKKIKTLKNFATKEKL